MLGINWIVSFLMQFPLQRRIRKGDAGVIGALVENDWLRVGAMGALCVEVALGILFYN
jgi:hypothetical protein